MEVNRTDLDGVAVIEIRGELDLHSAGIFKEKIDDLVRSGQRSFVLDLRQVDFIDSSGVGALLGRYRLLEKEGGVLALLSPPESVLMVLEMSGLTSLLPRFDSPEEAVKAVRGDDPNE